MVWGDIWPGQASWDSPTPLEQSQIPPLTGCRADQRENRVVGNCREIKRFGRRLMAAVSVAALYRGQQSTTGTWWEGSRRRNVCVCVSVPPILIFQLMCKGARGKAGILFSSSSCSMQRELPDIWRLSVVVTCFGKWCINNREFGQRQSTLISLKKMDLSLGETQIWCARGTKHLSVKGWRQRCGRSLQRCSIANVTVTLGCHYHDRTSRNETQWGHKKDMSFRGDKQLLWVLSAVYTWLLWESYGTLALTVLCFSNGWQINWVSEGKGCNTDDTLHLKKIIFTHILHQNVGKRSTLIEDQ